jgi:general secretion pathway protein G
MTSTQKVREQLLMAQNTRTGKYEFTLNPLKRNGFTLIEVMIVFTLIGILVAMGIPQYKYAAQRAREATLKEDLFILRKLINQYCVDKGEYPVSLEALVEDEYLMKIPKDPFTKSSDTWIQVQETLTEEEFIEGKSPGVIDVHSGSEEISLDGTPYNTW